MPFCLTRLSILILGQEASLRLNILSYEDISIPVAPHLLQHLASGTFKIALLQLESAVSTSFYREHGSMLSSLSTSGVGNGSMLRAIVLNKAGLASIKQ